MTKVVVNCGACGFSVTIKADKGEGRKIAVLLESECDMVRNMAQDIAVLDRLAPLIGLRDNPVYLAASKHLKHAACAVPSAVLKTIEIEAGLNVAKDVTIAFERKK